jgi:hypothetical protein
LISCFYIYRELIRTPIFGDFLFPLFSLFVIIVYNLPYCARKFEIKKPTKCCLLLFVFIAINFSLINLTWWLIDNYQLYY